ncbi:MAG TPA: PqqD family protein [Longimicrobiales bacterium]|nr:PqqD family protein [Longimicrobiales bacterium]
MTTGTLPAPNDAVVFRTVSDGAVLLHTAEEMYYGLNPVGARIWELLGECADMGQLCGRLAEAYPDAGQDQLREDVTALLADLRENGLVVDRGGTEAKP